MVVSPKTKHGMAGPIVAEPVGTREHCFVKQVVDTGLQDVSDMCERDLNHPARQMPPCFFLTLNSI